MADLFKVTKDLTFDAGHRVPNHASKCKNVHGHTYHIYATVEGTLAVENGKSDEAMVMDFGDLKLALTEEVHDRFDHRFIRSDKDVLFRAYKHNELKSPIPECSLGMLWDVDQVGLVQDLHCVPTAENLAWICFSLLSKRLNSNCPKFSPFTRRIRPVAGYRRVTNVKLYETPTCCAEYSGRSFGDYITRVWA